uniref:Cysteine-rich membrane protein 2 n=1 Tax=Spironucleus salmonicida TaxID=348837 RepID=V6LTA5_9EUKA|eukprot:EST47810.1 Cysteine-rich membrane protein 2 [Spironucleus salmonicida]
MIKKSLAYRENLIIFNGGCPVNQQRLDLETCVQCINDQSCGKFMFCYHYKCTIAENLPPFGQRCETNEDCGLLSCQLGQCTSCIENQSMGAIRCIFGAWQDGSQQQLNLYNISFAAVFTIYSFICFLCIIVIFRKQINGKINEKVISGVIAKPVLVQLL